MVSGMSTQIAVRIEDDQLAFVDALAAAKGVSRAAVVRRALARLRREEDHRHDAAALADPPAGAVADTAALVGWGAAHLPDLGAAPGAEDAGTPSPTGPSEEDIRELGVRASAVATWVREHGYAVTSALPAHQGTTGTPG